MSAPTPRTDALDNEWVKRGRYSDRERDMLMHARELERKLTEYKARAESAEIAQVEASMRGAPRPEVQPSMALVKEHKLDITWTGRDWCVFPDGYSMNDAFRVYNADLDQAIADCVARLSMNAPRNDPFSQNFDCNHNGDWRECEKTTCNSEMQCARRTSGPSAAASPQGGKHEG
jgi:hypothetical protein